MKDSFNANMAKVAAVAMTLAPAAAMATEGTNEVRQLFKAVRYKIKELCWPQSRNDTLIDLKAIVPCPAYMCHQKPGVSLTLCPRGHASDARTWQEPSLTVSLFFAHPF